MNYDSIVVYFIEQKESQMPKLKNRRSQISVFFKRYFISKDGFAFQHSNNSRSILGFANLFAYIRFSRLEWAYYYDVGNRRSSIQDIFILSINATFALNTC